MRTITKRALSIEAQPRSTKRCAVGSESSLRGNLGTQELLQTRGQNQAFVAGPWPADKSFLRMLKSTSFEVLKHFPTQGKPVARELRTAEAV